MNSRIAFVIALVSLMVALCAGWFAETQYQQLVATTEIVVPAVEIPPYTVVSPGMFKVRSFPAPMANENVYHDSSELSGKISTVTLEPDQLVYRDELVPLKEFRYTDDERLEVVSFPIKPEQAVGGQIRPGQRINLYRVVLQATPNQAVVSSPDPKMWLAAQGAGIEVLESDVLVVDVRSTQGSPIVSPPTVKSPTSEVTTYQAADTGSSNTNRPLTILTVAVPPDVAKDIVRLAGESQVTSRYLLWVSLAPIVNSK